MQAELVAVGQGEELHAAAGVDVARAGRDGQVERPALRVHILPGILLIAALGADVPFPDGPDDLRDHGEVREEVALARAGAVHPLQVDGHGAEDEAVAEGDIVDETIVLVLHEVDAPDGVPPGGHVAEPRQVVGVEVLEAQRQRGVAELEGEHLVGEEFVFGVHAEGEALVEVIAEVAVVVDVDWDGVEFVAADEEGVLARGQRQLGRGLPAEIQEVRGVEDVFGVEDGLVEPLADAEVELLRELAADVQVEVVAGELAAIFPVVPFLVEGSAGVEIQLRDLRLCGRSAAEQQGRGRGYGSGETFRHGFHRAVSFNSEK